MSFKKYIIALLLLCSISFLFHLCQPARETIPIIDPSILHGYIDKFNELDNELYKQDIDNSEAKDFLADNIPYFSCPDKQLEETYYFRWWTYRKHIKNTPDGYVISEFLPDVPWAGKNNTISCAAAHHFYEGRWLHNPDILSDYARFWFFGGGNPRLYSFWPAAATYAFHLVHPNKELIIGLYPELKENFSQWESEKQDSTTLFWQVDDRDGMEMSISGRLSDGGKGYRPTINSYMYGEAVALSKMALLLGSDEEYVLYNRKAENIKQSINNLLWNEQSEFYQVIPINESNEFSTVRELHGFTPWYFNIPPDNYSSAWLQLIDTAGFQAPYGPTTAEQRSPDFRISYTGHECQWNGPSWPYSTSITLVSLANLLNNYTQSYLTKKDYVEILRTYSNSHQLRQDNGNVVPWIDENLNPYTGDWISRTRLKTWNNDTWDSSKGGIERGKDYNHSSFCDLIISGLVGVRPQDDNSLIINPLIPDNYWEYFCLDNILYKNHIITILYDANGRHYNKGKGFIILVDGKRFKKASKISELKITLPG